MVRKAPGRWVLPRGPGSSAGSLTGPRAAWVLALVVLTVALALLQALGGPTLLRQSAAVALGVVLALGLAVRSGSSVPLATGFAATLGVMAVVTQWDPLLAGAAVGVAVVGACLAVLCTRPAARFVAVAVEVVVALLVATTGGLAAAGLAADIDTERVDYTVLVLTLVCATALVHRLAGGLHLLGRRGMLLMAVAVVLLVVVLVYTAALTEYGSPALVERVRSARDWTRETLGGVPHPVEFLVGIPALAWGVSLRTRRRQGWWVCALGSVAPAHLAADLLDPGEWSVSSALAVVYSLVLGLGLGAVLIRLERAITGRGPGGRRTRGEPPLVLREEPPRLSPLH